MIPYQIVITREEQDETQTLGKLQLFDNSEELFKCKTLELPWKENKQNVSCIPKGHYETQKHVSPNFGESIWIKGVPNRSEILIHKGNFYTDILGCILVGEKYADIDGDGHKDVTNSANTIKTLYGLIPSGASLFVNVV